MLPDGHLALFIPLQFAHGRRESRADTGAPALSTWRPFTASEAAAASSQPRPASIQPLAHARILFRSRVPAAATLSDLGSVLGEKWRSVECVRASHVLGLLVALHGGGRGGGGGGALIDGCRNLRAFVVPSAAADTAHLTPLIRGGSSSSGASCDEVRLAKSGGGKRRGGKQLTTDCRAASFFGLFKRIFGKGCYATSANAQSPFQVFQV